MSQQPVLQAGESMTLTRCPLCGKPSSKRKLAQGAWLAPDAFELMLHYHPDWRREDGACPACVQHVMLHILLEQGEGAMLEHIQRVWPLNAEAAFGAIPTPLRMHADPRYTGKGVTIAFIDTGFYPHDDLTKPKNRIKAWVDARQNSVAVSTFDKNDTPSWPGSDAASDEQWHGLMTSSVAAGNGHLGHGFYSGMASEADVVLIQIGTPDEGKREEKLLRALKWLLEHHTEFVIKVASISLGSDSSKSLAVDKAVNALVEAGVTVMVAAGNDGVRQLLPPATAPLAITVGGLDDQNIFDHDAWMLWHSNYGETKDQLPKPELVAPSIWVVAPVLPGSIIAEEAKELFRRRARNDSRVNERISALKLITPHYQHVDGTSFAAPLVAGTAACMLEANPKLTPAHIRDLLLSACEDVPGAVRERQGAGALNAGKAVALALSDEHEERYFTSPIIEAHYVRFLYHDHNAKDVRVFGAWDNWATPGISAREIEAGMWEAVLPLPKPDSYTYKFLINNTYWIPDPANPARIQDGFGNHNSFFLIRSD
jgi:serine protease AprX